MKCLKRNKIPFYYALYDSKVPIVDEYGNATGEYEIKRGSPLAYHANISSARGETQTQQFGENENYDRVIEMDKDGPDIDEYSVLWIDVVPELDEEGKTTTPYDYVVKKVARSINSVAIAISKVNVKNE